MLDQIKAQVQQAFADFPADTPEQREELANRLRTRAHNLEIGVNAADQSIGESIPEFGLPARETVVSLNQDSAHARLLRARAARLEGNEAYAVRLESQAARVLETGSWD